MKGSLAILATVWLAACGGDDEVTDGVTIDPTVSCLNSILNNFPEEGETAAYYRTDARFGLVTEDPSAVITVADGDGNPVAGSSMIEGTTVIWTADAPLSPSTSYVSSLEYECGVADVNWTTSAVGGPVDVDVTNEVFNLDLASGQFIRPPGVGKLLASLVVGVEILVMPVSVDTEITLLGAVGLGNGDFAQDLCTETFELPPASFAEDPYFSLEADELPLEIAGISATINGLTLSGAFAADGSSIQGVSLQGDIDTRPLVDVLGTAGDENSVCALVEGFGVPCVACADGSGDFCLSLWVDNIDADATNTDPLVVRDVATIDKDPLCQPKPKK